MKILFKNFLYFGFKQVVSCVFPAIVFILLAISHLLANYIPRYDFMLLACLVVQFELFYSKLETLDEVKVICIFHLLGLVMELAKVYYGSWSYPEFAWSKIYGVPLYSGFMYASVASYLCQAWRNFDLKFIQWPNHVWVRILGFLIYVNFFTNHYILDFRYLIALFIAVSFRKSWVEIKLLDIKVKLPVIVSFLLIGFFIWIPENVATFLGAWQYTYQHKTWSIVNYHKISSWAFLVIVSYIIVAELKMVKLKIMKT